MTGRHFVGRCSVRATVGVVAVGIMTATAARGQGVPRSPSAGATIADSAGFLRPHAGPTVPKVPFNNQPCLSITDAEAKALGASGPLRPTPHRAPGNLPIDNACSYYRGGTLMTEIGYMTDGDIRMNRGSNRSATHQAPSDLPDAFYDGQGGLWFAKNGYDVVVSGRSVFKEPVARLLAGKL